MQRTERRASVTLVLRGGLKWWCVKQSSVLSLETTSVIRLMGRGINVRKRSIGKREKQQ